MNKLKKSLSAVLAALMVAVTVSACANNNAGNASSAAQAVSSQAKVESAENAAKIDMNIATLKGPSGIGMAKIMEDASAGITASNYKFSLATDPTEIVSKISSGEVDIAAIPTNLAATLYNKTEGKVNMLALSGLGVLYVLSNGEPITNVSDLKGKTIYATGQGSTPEYALNYILQQNGLDPAKDVTIEYKGEHSELAALVASGDAKIAMLPEPFVTQVTSKNADVKVALDLTKEWSKAVGGKSDLSMTAIVARKDFVEKNKAAVDKFLAEYKESVNYTNTNIDGAAALSEKYDVMAAAVAKKAIPNCNIVYVDGSEMQSKTADFLNILFTANPKSVGGKLPGEDFYYKK